MPRTRPSQIDPTEVRQHLEALLAAGCDLKWVSKQTNLKPAALERILDGVTFTIRKEVARKLFAVRLGEQRLPPLEIPADGAVSAETANDVVKELLDGGIPKPCIDALVGGEWTLGMLLTTQECHDILWDAYLRYLRDGLEVELPEGRRVFRAKPKASPDIFTAVETILIERIDQNHWRRHAACRGMDPDAFFIRRGGSDEEARRVCAACPVRQPCTEAHISVREGFFGASRHSRRALQAAG